MLIERLVKMDTFREKFMEKVEVVSKAYDHMVEEQKREFARRRMEITDFKKLHENIIKWIRDWFDENGTGCNAVIGISGGKDSTICCALLCEALGKERVVGIMLPNGKQHDLNVAQEICKYYGIKHFTIDIQHAVNTYKRMLEVNGVEITLQTKYNIPPRVRMTTLYAFSQSLNGRVVNTSNLSEDYVGWMTMFGDAAGDFSPLSFLTVTEVKKLGYEIGVPVKWVDKAPEDGLVGHTDEEALGVTYAQIDEYICSGQVEGNPEAEDRIKALHEKSAFKLKPMAAYKPTIGDLCGKHYEMVGTFKPRYDDKRQEWWQEC